tara:strand:- start:25209 stop:26099 length:891 start_codon:yes stop_codon:yes gene_type:complete
MAFTDRSSTSTDFIITNNDDLVSQHGKAGKSVLFDESSGYVALPTGSVASYPSFSYSAWVKYDNTGGGAVLFPRLVSLGASEENVFYIGKSSLTLGLDLNFSTTDGYWTSKSDAITANNWHHVAVTYASASDADPSFYVDGIALTLTTEDLTPHGTLNTHSGPGGIGGSSGGGFLYKGNIQDVSIWDIALGVSAITDLYNSGAPGDLRAHSNFDSLVAWWKMGLGEAGDSTTILDQISGTATTNGILQGAASIVSNSVDTDAETSPVNVPFRFGQRGPMSLRLRPTATPYSASFGG